MSMVLQRGKIGRFQQVALFAFAAFVALVASYEAGLSQSKAQDQAYLKAGIKSLGEGKASTAIDQLSRAVKSAKLPEADMAMALYKRGQAYRASNQHGLAIADLTNALYLKALSKKDTENAYLERARAFASLGMQTQTSADIKAAGKMAADNKSTAIKSDAAGIKPAVTPSLRAAAAPAKTQNVTGSEGGSLPVPAAAVAPAQTPQSSSFDPVSSVTSFFENLIPGSGSNKKPGGQSSGNPQIGVAPTPAASVSAPSRQATPTALSQTNRPVWMADPSVTTPQPPPEVPFVIDDTAPRSGVEHAQNWSGLTKVRATTMAAPVTLTGKIRGAPAPSRKPAGSDIVGGVVSSPSKQRTQLARVPASEVVAKRYYLQLAMTRSQNEAGRVWNKLATSHPQLLSGLTPNIYPVGQAGYLVGLGPFNGKPGTERICRTFKQQGLSCRVYAQ